MPSFIQANPNTTEVDGDVYYFSIAGDTIEAKPVLTVEQINWPEEPIPVILTDTAQAPRAGYQYVPEIESAMFQGQTENSLVIDPKKLSDTTKALLQNAGGPNDWKPAVMYAQGNVQFFLTPKIDAESETITSFERFQLYSKTQPPGAFEKLAKLSQMFVLLNSYCLHQGKL
eukprot:GHVT01094618.1.p1 GENE.GHVT01094618.1~~GHVT01094618.1.p1  ORF type:complete len:172 (+),score=8.16 GHVT01094618.1:1079-1594(+)